MKTNETVSLTLQVGIYRQMKKSHLSFIAEAWQNYLNYCRTVTTCILLNKNKDKLIKKTPCVKKKKKREKKVGNNKLLTTCKPYLLASLPKNHFSKN